MSTLQEPQFQSQSQTDSCPGLAINLVPATETDLPALVDLQFQCFNQTVLIEKITNPDTPDNRATMVESHRKALREDQGMLIVKAVAPSNEAGHETIAGFCIFHYPVPSSTNPGSWILPLPLRTTFDETPTSAAVNARESETAPSPRTSPSARSELSTATDLTLARGDPIAVPTMISDQGGNGESVASSSVQIQISQTNIPTLLPDRKRTLNRLVAQRARYETDWPPPIGYVRYMCVSPLYRRHGIGSRLMDWGCKRFDEQGLDAFLQATAEGEPMYERFGFSVVGEQVLRVYGVQGIEGERYSSMWRDVQGSDSEREHERERQ